VSEKTVLSVFPLGFPWQTADPFLFCVHHEDAYPAGNEDMGPATSLSGRNIGMDFEGLDGWRMYHGDTVPGFPRHPHRGFETVTLVRRGFIDHSDSLGATARFGQGDVQWMTAGKGIVHAEMFPLRDRAAPNPLELFQIWLNLPKADKMVEPYFTMLWAPTIPRHTLVDEKGRTTRVVTVTGTLGHQAAPPPPPNSWSARPDADVAIWTIEMAPGARWMLPPARGEDTVRTLYFFRGERLTVGEHVQASHAGLVVRADVPLALENGDADGELLLLQGRSIGDPVVHHGPFVMNTPGEIKQAMIDYQRTGFGGWPWESDGPVHPREEGRFAIHVDGRREEPS
jgi:redox-sensitive bicupin YhaK (pirin superfamily)